MTSFADRHSVAGPFFISQADAERRHIAASFPSQPRIALGTLARHPWRNA